MAGLSGKVALVTGAAHGIGRAIATRLARDGADIVAVDIDGEISDSINYRMGVSAELAGTCALVEKCGRRALAGTADVRNFAEISKVVDDALSTFGGIDIVCPNAGVAGFGWFWELPEEQWDVIFDVNVKGVWNTVRAVVPSMLERAKGGSVVITGSIAGVRPFHPQMHYVASKHAVVGIGRAMANELGPYDIRVNIVHPGGTLTTIAEGELSPDVIATVAPQFRTVLPREGYQSPDEISNAVAWLVSDEARNVTGVELTVDAGTTVKP